MARMRIGSHDHEPESVTTAPGAAKRLRWAVDTMAPGPGDRILEVGCGHGVAVTLVSLRLEGGTIIGVDRSEKMIAAATRRNRVHVDADRAFLLCTHFPDTGLEPWFDTIYASNVNEFRKRPGPALAEVRRLLRPGGRLYLFWRSPSWEPGFDKRGFAEPIATTLADHGLIDVRIVIGPEADSDDAFAITAAAA